MNNKTVIWVLILLLVIGGISFAYLRSTEPVSPTEPIVEEPNTSGAPTFTWSYKSFEEKEIPRSTISLTATYPDGESVTKEIGTVQGGCNEHPDPDKDVYSKSTMILCYYAGFGEYYKVVESNGKYLVQRKEIEEASPDYNPPLDTFKTVVEF